MADTTIRIEQTNLSTSNSATTSSGDIELGTLFASTYKQVWNKAINGLFRTGSTTAYGDIADVEGRGLFAAGKNSNGDTQTSTNYGYTACSNNVIVMQDLYNGIPVDQFAVVLTGAGSGLKLNQRQGFPIFNIDRATGNLTSKVISGSSVLDQSFGSRNATSGATNPWQSVTAGITGLLTSVSVHNSSGIAASGYTIRIFSGTGTGGTLLASAAGPYTPDNTWGTVTFTTPPYITAGTVFSIQVYNGSGFGWSVNTGGGYSGGYFNGSPGIDALFQTYVDSGYSLTSDNTALISSHPYFKARGLNLNTSIFQSIETITGTNASITAGPHKWIYTSASSTYPIFQQLNWGQDNIALSFDSYFNGTNWISSDSGSNYQFYKNSDVFNLNYKSGVAQGSNITWDTGITLNTSGYVGVNISSATERFQVYGNIGIVSNDTYNYGLVLYNGSTTNSWIMSNPSGGGNDLYLYYNWNWRVTISDVDGTYNKSSDERLKDDIQPLTNVLSNISNINVASYLLKGQHSAGRRINVIAQSVLPYYPEIISTINCKQDWEEEAHDYYTVSSDGVGVIALAACKELLTRVEALEALHQN